MMGRMICGQATTLAYVDIISISAVVFALPRAGRVPDEATAEECSARGGALISDRFRYAGVAQFAQPVDAHHDLVARRQPARRLA